MSRIKSIKINNFKFFKNNQPPIEIGGKNLILYGENGSGKSAIYRALHTLFDASVTEPSEIVKYFMHSNDNPNSYVNIYAYKMSHIQTKIEHVDSYIEVVLKDHTKYYLSLLDTQISKDPSIGEIRKSSDFINYQSLFKFHDFRHEDDNDLYNIFVDTILPYVNFRPANIPNTRYDSMSNAREMWDEFQKGPGTTRNKKGKIIQAYKHSPQNKNYETFASHFNDELKALIDNINTEAPKILDKLGYEFNLSLNLIEAKYKKGYTQFDWTPFKVELSIILDNTYPIKKVHSFLNEAKMTALAIAIRIAILGYRKNNNAKSGFIVFDDVMISLDMNNREVLTNYILNTLAKDYQIIILTHSKEFAEFFKQKISHSVKKSWLYKEMYEGSNEQNHKYPVIVDESMSNLEKAEKYFNEIHDYDIAALYLRKSFEEAIVEKLPPELTKKVKGSYIPLESLWGKFYEWYKTGNETILNDDSAQLFKDSKLLILNHSAHFQRLSRPIYKRELENVFDLIYKLKTIKKRSDKLIIEKDKEIIFKHPNQPYICKFKLIKDLEINWKNNILSIPKCCDIHFEYNSIPYYDDATKQEDFDHSLRTSTPKLTRFLQTLLSLKIGNPLNITKEIFIKNSTIDGVPLKNYLDDIDLFQEDSI